MWPAALDAGGWRPGLQRRWGPSPTRDRPGVWRLLPAVLLGLLLAGCGNLLNLHADLKEARTNFHRVAGRIESPTCPECPTIVVALGDRSGRQVHTYRVFEKPGKFDMVILAGSRYLFAFNDLNGDFEYQPDEPSGWYELTESPSGKREVAGIVLRIRPAEPDAGEGPQMGDLSELRGITLGSVDVQLGQVVDLDDARFEPEVASMGVWQPIGFMKAGHAGLYFLEEYTPHKVPVLFMHGINGSPRDFAGMIAGLDRTRFQPWLLHYPSGLALDALGNGLLGMLSELDLRYNVKELHLVAHSLGGLLAQSYLKACEELQHCAYVRSFTSISTPFGGSRAAQTGVDRSPVVVPVWKSIAPGSRFLRELFVRPLPPRVSHYLLFGYRNSSRTTFRSGDGVIPLESQLRAEAQAQSRAMRGFDQDHSGILDDDAVHAYVNRILSGSGGDHLLAGGGQNDARWAQ